MDQNKDSGTTGPGLGVAGVSVQSVDGPVKYETAKGCMSFVLIALALVAVTVIVIVLASDPATVAG